MGLFGKKPKPKRFVKCGRTWQEKVWVGPPKTGHWFTTTRHCTREAGHSGGCR
jgi:hypothetical protein